MYMVVDTISRNILGQCDTLPQAKSLFLELVAYHPQAATEIVILSESGARQDVSREEVVDALAAAAG